MLIQLLRAKVQNLTLTGKDLNYEGSITLGDNILKASGLFEGERVQVLNKNNGIRLETYIIRGKNGEVVLNGPAARMGERGDTLFVLSYGLVSLEQAPAVKPVVLIADEKNNPK